MNPEATPLTYAALVALRDKLRAGDVERQPIAVPPNEVGISMLALLGVDDASAREWMRRQGVNV